MSKLITETFFGEVVNVSHTKRYLNGYDKPQVEFVELTVRAGHNATDGQSLRTVSASLPGNLPIGTRFKITIEQVDEVTPATIHRGALPEVVDSKQLEGQS